MPLVNWYFPCDQYVMSYSHAWVKLSQCKREPCMSCDYENIKVVNINIAPFSS